jgi:hypothetical protein
MRNKWLFSAWQRIFLAGTLFAVPLIYTPQRVQAVGGGEIISHINTQRANNGLTPLRSSGSLNSSALARAQHMLRLGYWGHTGPDGSTMVTFISRSGYGYTAIGENLARDPGSSAGTVSLWMGSAVHRANIQSSRFKDVGVGVASGSISGVPTTIVVAHFGASTVAPSPAPKPAPRPAAQTAPRPTKITEAAASQSNIKRQATVPKKVTPASKKVQPKPQPKKSFNDLLMGLDAFATSPTIRLIEAKTS